LTQPAQEPVAVHQFRLMYSADWHDGYPDPKDGHGPYETRTLYAASPKHTWVGLTDEDRKAALLTAYKEWECEEFLLCAREDYLLIEQALKEKNNGT